MRSAKHALVGAGARALERDHEVRVALLIGM